MRTIKFSHEYKKMPEGFENSILMEVLIADRADLHTGFIEYDTAIVGGGNYSPPRGKLLVLLLMAHKSAELWTTVRRWTPEKEAYYRGLRGKHVRCKVIIKNKRLF